jgi:hypothetical protein
MKRANMKTADDVIVQDGAAGLRRLAAATRHIVSLGKPISSRANPRKKRRSKK